MRRNRYAQSVNPLSANRPYARKGSGDVFPTVVALPTRPQSEYTVKARQRAVEETFMGRLRLASDIMRAALNDSGIISGLTGTISHGILGLPLALQGDPEMISCLLDQDGSPGEFGRMFPESEAAQVFTDGIILGVGLGQMIYKSDRAIGDREVPTLRWWNTRWLRQDPYSRQWFLMTRDGEIEIHPGDGEWILFRPYSEIEPWENAPWKFLTLAFVFGRDAAFDRQRHSEVLAPARVMRAVKSTTKEARAKAKRKLERMQRDNYFVLPQEWEYEIKESTGRVADIYRMIIEWATRDVEIGLTGQTVTTEGNKGFSEGTIHQRIARDKLRFYAGAWFRCVRDQYLVHWGAINHGTRIVPTGGYNVDPPEDILAKAEALTKWGESLEALADGADRHGVEVDPQWVIEEGQRRGVRLRVKPAKSPSIAALTFAPDDLANFVTVNEARLSQGLSAIPDGDITVAAYLEKVKGTQVPGVDMSAIGASRKLRATAKARGWRLRRAKR